MIDKRSYAPWHWEEVQRLEIERSEQDARRVLIDERLVYLRALERERRARERTT
jgi:hypothetical protein